MQTDDNGNVYLKDNKLMPNSEYTLNGVTYKTDENGNKISWEGTLKTYSPEAERDGNAQAESGGKDRLPGDDGGHLEARILGGDPGNGNLEPMRDTVNRGDYKRSENEIADAINNGNEVHDKGTIYREDPNTTRPTKIEREYEYGETKKVLIVDNVEGSIDLVDSLEGVIDDVDYQNLKDEIQEMKDDGDKVSVTSTCKELNPDGSVKKVTVGIRDETTGDKWYQSYTPGSNA
ncbi:MAG: DNA/RNA non-specific endonuclease [archaeon]|nr:DNA/RNA non-specific endonuclease [archaeon]